MKKIIIALTIFIMTLSPVKAETISFKEVLDKAIKNSYDLKLSQTDIKITDTEIKEARSAYLPTISLEHDDVYNKDLTNGTSVLTSIGTTSIINNTIYENALTASLQYNLFDFGVRKMKLDMAKKDKKAKQTEYIKNVRDLKTGLAEAYTKALLSNRELATNQELLALNKTLFSMYEGLYNAGTVRKTDLADQALKVAVLTNKIDDLITQTKNAFSDLSFYTGESYTTSAKILPLSQEKDGVIPVNNSVKFPIQLEASKLDILNVEKLPEYKEYQLQIEEKKAELSSLKRQNLPQLKFSTNYYLYGTDPGNFFDTFKDFGNKSAAFELSTIFPVFDGFKNQAQCERAKLEMGRLAVERDKKVQSIKTYYEKVYNEAKDNPQKLENQATALRLTEEKIEMLDKLNEQHLIDKISYLKQKSDLITQKFEHEKTKINSEATAYKISILAESEEEQLPQNNSHKKNIKTKLQQSNNKTIPKSKSNSDSQQSG